MEGNADNASLRKVGRFRSHNFKRESYHDLDDGEQAAFFVGQELLGRFLNLSVGVHYSACARQKCAQANIGIDAAQKMCNLSFH